ncbi:MAG: phosphorylase family protein [Promethearchaeota archaeon]
MFENIANKMKNAAINLALKAMSKKDRLSQMFLSTFSSNINPIIILPATFSVGKMIHSLMRNPRKYGQVYSGLLNGVKVTMIRTGMGTASISVIMETMKLVKPRAIVRIDYAGSLDPGLPVGGVFVADHAIPGDGTTMHYIHAYPEVLNGDGIAINNVDDLKSCPDPVYKWLIDNKIQKIIPCDERLRDLVVQVATKIGLNVDHGTIFTTDALFLETKEKVEFWRAMGARGIDMETSLIYFLGKLFKIPAIAIHGISDNLLTQKPFYELDHLDPGVSEGIKKACRLMEELVPII